MSSIYGSWFDYKQLIYLKFYCQEWLVFNIVAQENEV
jgi:hypothetical protein